MEQINSPYPNIVKLDRSSPIPLYYQLQSEIKQQISEGFWSPGDKLPSIRTLAVQYGVSMAVIRQAVHGLVQENILETHQGRGIYIKKSVRRLALDLLAPQFYEEAERLGLDLSLKVLVREFVSHSEITETGYDIFKQGKVVHIRKVRYAEKVPLVLADAYIPEFVCSSLMQPDISSEDINRLLEEDVYTHITNSDTVASAQLANEKESSILQVQKDAPLLVFEGASFNNAGTVIQYAIVKSVPWRIRFGIQLEELEFIL